MEDNVEVAFDIEAFLNSHPGFLDEFFAKKEARKQEALKIFPEGKADCALCDINCQGFWFPETSGGDCGEWGIPMKSLDAYGEILPIDEIEGAH